VRARPDAVVAERILSPLIVAIKQKPRLLGLEAKRAQIVKSDFALNEEVQFIPTPGHTIDHYSVLIGRPGEDVLITGDMIHSPIQGRYPELGMCADYDSPQVGKTRRQVFLRGTYLDVRDALPRVRRWGNGCKFVA
jgi:glyoxylase-like metal-dependent hydrolase (beta-lactamase superfamily II)